MEEKKRPWIEIISYIGGNKQSFAFWQDEVIAVQSLQAEKSSKIIMRHDSYLFPNIPYEKMLKLCGFKPLDGTINIINDDKENTDD